MARQTRLSRDDTDHTQSSRHRVGANVFLSFVLMFLAISQVPVSFAHASGGVPMLLPFQGRATDGSGHPINYQVNVVFRIYPPTGNCYLYEETQTLTPNAYGLFSTNLGSGTSTGPANSLVQVFNNDPTASIPTDSCGNYTPAANHWRRIQVLVDGVAMADMQTIGASAFALNSQTLQGFTASSFIRALGSVSQNNLNILTGGGDASALHHHDSRYAKSDGSTPFTGNITTTGNIYAPSATGSMGIGTATPQADLEISKNAAGILLRSASGGGGSSKVDFFGGATQRGSIQVNEATNGMRFYSGTSEAMRLDATGNAIFYGSATFAGSVGLGKYTDAQEVGLQTVLSGLGAAAAGTVWVNTTSGTIKYWTGTAIQTLMNGTTAVTSVGAGNGLNNSGTATAPVLNVLYGSTANTAIQGNAAFGGDVSGNYTNISVNRIRGIEVDSVPPTNGQILVYDNAASKWVASAPPATGITQLNGLTGTNQSLSVGTTGTSPNFVSSGTTHTLNIPLAATAGTTAGLLSKSEYDSFSAKQNALGFTPVNRAGDSMTGILTLSADPTANMHSVTKQYVDSAIGTAGGSYIRRDGTAAFTGDQSLGTFKLTNVGDPTAAQDAATKNYVDTGLSGKQNTIGYTPVNRAGDTMTGLLTLSADPTNALHAATKQYVDSVSAGAANAIQRDGSVAFTAAQSMGAFRLTNVGDPTAAQDAATKNYVDTGLAGKQNTIGYTPVNRAGDTMTGLLTLSADPTNALHAATKQYVDSVSAVAANAIQRDGSVDFTGNQSLGTFKLTNVGDPTAAQDAATKNYVDTGLSGKQNTIGYTPVNRAGDTMTGLLTLSADPTNALHAATKQYVDSVSAGAANAIQRDGSAVFTADQSLGTYKLTNVGDPTAAQDAATKNYVDTGLSGKQNTIGYTPVNRAGDTMTGLLTLSADPTANLHSATKQYVDSAVSTAGGSFIRRDGTVAYTGDQSLGTFKLTNVGDPTAAQDAATKNYVDTGLAGKQNTIGYTPVNRAGDTMTGLLTLSADPTNALHAATKQYVDSVATGAANAIQKDGSVAFTAAQSMGTFRLTNVGDPTAAQDAATKNYVDTGLSGKQNTIGYTPVNRAGDTMTGLLTLSADPTNALHAATKQYVDSVSAVAANAIQKDGSVVFTANQSLGTYKLTNVGDPTAAQDAATKNYVDTGLSGKQNTIGYTPVNRAGDTMTGLLTLSADPTANLHSATKQYVDSAVSTAGGSYIRRDGTVAYTGDQSLGTYKLTNVGDPTAAQDAATKNYVDTGLSGKQNTIGYTPVNRAGDTMTGLLTLSADPTNALHAATKQYVDSVATGAANAIQKDGSVAFTAAQSMGTFRLTNVGDPTAAQDAATKNYVDTGLSGKQNTIGYTPVNRAGDTMTGILTLSADPTNALHAATKQYVDTGLSGKQNTIGYTPVNRAGDTMTGLLTLSADPTNALHAATKQYVDSVATGAANAIQKDGSVAFTAAQSMGTFRLTNVGDPTAAQDAATKNYVDTGLSGKQNTIGYTPVNRAGDTMTGLLTLSADPTNALHAATKQYVDSVSAVAANAIQKDGSVVFTANQSLGTYKLTNVGDPTAAQDAATKNYVDTGLSGKQNTIGYTPVNRAGDTMTGLLTLSADPTNALHAATKQYVDTGLSGKQNTIGYTPVNRAGDTMTGLLTLSADPTNALHAATKQYVDSVSAGAANAIQRDGSVAFTAAQSMGTFRLTNVGDPTAAQDAATKNYVDTGLSGKQNTIGYTPVNRAGDTMTGLLTLSADPTNALHAATKQYVDSVAAGSVNAIQKDGSVAFTGNQSLGTFKLTNVGDPTAAQDAATKNYVDTGLAGKQNTIGYTPVNRAGDTMTGILTLSADPTANLHSATKQYVDSAVSTAGGSYIRRDGTAAFTADQSLGTFKLTNVGDPTAGQDAATKNYVDTGLSGKQNTIGYTTVNRAGDTMTGALNLPSNGLAVGTNQLVVSRGNVGIGNASPGAKLDVTGDVRATAFLYSSDRRLKKEIRQLDGLNYILQLRGVHYSWRSDGKKDIGLIAQEVEQVLPELVVQNPENGMKSVKYGNLVAPLIEAVKSLFSRQNELESRVEKLEAENRELRAQIDEIHKMLQDRKPASEPAR